MSSPVREFPRPSRGRRRGEGGLPSKGWSPAKAGHVGGTSLTRQREKAFLAAGVDHAKVWKQECMWHFQGKD